MISLSIVVPVYKVEPFIEKCIKSILENRFFDTHCELVIVDDGSPDRSMEIVESLCDALPNVTLVHQPNQGLGVARNTGESIAKGEYLWFVDSDDWLLAGAIEKILTIITETKPDIVNIDYVMSDTSHSAVINNAENGIIYTGLTYLSISCVQNPVQYYVFRTNYYRDSGLQFEKDIYHEDSLFTPIALFHALRVVRLMDDCYVYNLREGSIMTSGNNLKHAFDMITVSRKLEAFRLLHAIESEHSRIISRYIALAIGSVFYYWKRLGQEDRHRVSSCIDNWLFLKSIYRSRNIKYLIHIAIMLVYRPLKLGKG